MPSSDPHIGIIGRAFGFALHVLLWSCEGICIATLSPFPPSPSPSVSHLRGMEKKKRDKVKRLTCPYSW